MAEGRSSPSSAVDWSSLPDELLGVVSSKLASPPDRVRFAAVCISWRAALLRHPPLPTLPLLLLSSGYQETEKLLYCPEDDCIFSVPLTHRLCDMYFNGSYDGGWVVACSKSPGCRPVMILNLFSGVKVALSKKQRSVECARHRGHYMVCKTIFSEAPTSSSCILAAMNHKCNIALCRVGCPDGGWTMEGCEREELGDIAFIQGELYGLTRCTEDLIKYDIGENEYGAPVVTAARQMNVKRRDGPVYKDKCLNDYVRYIFELRGNLAMAVMIQWSENRRAFFKVFELAQADADDDAHDYKWVELLSLGDYALFLGPKFSCRIVHVPAGGRGGVERNHIYYSHYRSRYTNHDKESGRKTYLTARSHGDRMYCREDQNACDSGDDVEQIAALGYYVTDGPHVPMWFFPPDF
ncbi:unnamed protein product [Alopecurus aequalis]